MEHHELQGDLFFQDFGTWTCHKSFACNGSSWSSSCNGSWDGHLSRTLYVNYCL